MSKPKIQIPPQELRVTRVLRFPPDVHRLLKKKTVSGNISVREVFHRAVRTRLSETVQALEKLGFADIPKGAERKSMRVRFPVALLEELRKAEKRTGLDPMAILFVLLRAELRR